MCFAVIGATTFADDVAREFPCTDAESAAKAEETCWAQLASRVDVSEIYSPPRVCPHARALGLSPGWSIDLRTGYDLSTNEDQRKVVDMMYRDRPRLIILSPDCANASTLFNLQVHLPW